MAIILTALRMCARFFADGRWEFGDGRPVDTALIRRAIEAAEQVDTGDAGMMDYPFLIALVEAIAARERTKAHAARLLGIEVCAEIVAKLTALATETQA